MRFQISDRITEVDVEHRVLYLCWRFSSIIDRLRIVAGDRAVRCLLNYLLFDYFDLSKKTD